MGLGEGGAAIKKKIENKKKNQLIIARVVLIPFRVYQTIMIY